MKRLTIVPFSLFMLSITSQVSYNWSHSFGEGNEEHYGNCIDIDDQGNSYIAGVFSDAVDFDPSATQQVLTANSYQDCFVQKLDVNGNLDWAFNIGSTSSEYPFDIHVDQSGNIYVAGVYGDSIDLDPGVNEDWYYSLGGDDGFLAKYDNNGNYQWGLSLGAGSNDEATGVATDAGGNVVLVGMFKGMVDFDPGTGEHFINAGSTNATSYVLKLDPNGNFDWVYAFGGSTYDGLNDVAINQDGDIYVAGEFTDSFIYSVLGTPMTATAVGGRDILFGKLTEMGTALWFKTVGSPATDRASDVALDGMGKVYFSGRFGGGGSTVDFDPSSTGNENRSTPGQFGAFVEKLTENGDFIWASTLEGTGYGSAYSLDVDDQGNAYYSGYFNGTLDFASGTTQIDYTAVGSEDIYLQKLDSSGNNLWMKTYGSAGDESFGYGIAANVDYIVATGSFGGSIDLDPNGGGAMHSTTGWADVFVLNLNQCNLEISVEFLDGTLTAQANGLSYQWVDCDNNNSLITGETNQSFTPTINSNYAVILSNGSCVDTSSCIQVSNVSLSELEHLKTSIYPNPVNDELFIQSIDNSSCHIQVYDSKGKLILKENSPGQSIQLSHIEPGVYIIRIESNQMIYQEKLIKQ